MPEQERPAEEARERHVESEQPALGRPAAPCKFHPETLTTWACDLCGNWVCAKCRALVDAHVRCPSCQGTLTPKVPLGPRLLLAASLFALAAAGFHRLAVAYPNPATLASSFFPIWVRSLAPRHVRNADDLVWLLGVGAWLLVFSGSLGVTRLPSPDRGILVRTFGAIGLVLVAIVLHNDSIYGIFFGR